MDLGAASRKRKRVGKAGAFPLKEVRYRRNPVPKGVNGLITVNKSGTARKDPRLLTRVFFYSGVI